VSEPPPRPPVPPELQRGHVTGDLPPVPGEARTRPEDFEVDEVPLYEPCGEGEHLYLKIRKRGITTDEALRRLSKRLGVKRRNLGYAGRKDARAITTQTLSAQGVPVPEDLAPLCDEQLEILSASRHRNKLKVGHLLGNRFRLTIRGGGGGLAVAQTALARLEAKGVPNAFGLQRFGRNRTTHRLGEALVREDAEGFLELLIQGARVSAGEPPPPVLEGSPLAEARAAAASGDYRLAANRFPRSFSSELAACRALADGRDGRGAVRSVASKQRMFYVAAFQSLLFNSYLRRRLDRLDQIDVGEVVTLHRNGASFRVTEPERDRPRCAAFEISPSGPLFGRRLLRPEEGSVAFDLEQQVLAELAPGLEPTLTDALGAKPQGLRRPLRIPLREVSVEQEGDDLRISFFLPKGCYATAVLEELFKRQVD
jgi:tRNA pseudouridine13 synthase